MRFMITALLALTIVSVAWTLPVGEVDTNQQVAIQNAIKQAFQAGVGNSQSTLLEASNLQGALGIQDLLGVLLPVAALSKGSQAGSGGAVAL